MIFYTRVTLADGSEHRFDTPHDGPEETGRDPLSSQPTDVELTVDQHFGVRIYTDPNDEGEGLNLSLVQFRVGGGWSQPVPLKQLAEEQVAARPDERG